MQKAIMNNKILRLMTIAVFFSVVFSNCSTTAKKEYVLNEKHYFETQGANFIVFTNWYAGLFGDEKMSGIELIHHGERTATNGDVRINPTPEQWDPIPKFIERKVDSVNQTIEAILEYPQYNFKYSVIAKPKGESMLIQVHIDEPIPDVLVGKAAFNMEFLPAAYFEKSFLMDQKPGAFPLYPTGPMTINDDGQTEALPFAEGVELVMAPEDPQKHVAIETSWGKLSVYDGRNKAQNGWYVVRTLIPANKTGVVVEWTLTAHTIDQWIRKPNVAYSQLGYHPAQNKVAVIELDKNDNTNKSLSLFRIENDGKTALVKKAPVQFWGEYLRYNYATFDFSEVQTAGVYYFELDNEKTTTFRIDHDVYQNAWQASLDVYMPVQMDHMFVREAYRVWHGRAHMDDALQAPVNHEHFDLYAQGPTTDTQYKPGEHIPGLNVGGWFDAGDFDLRTQTHYHTITTMVDAWEQFAIDRDETLIDQETGYVEIHHPDGKPDLLQQIEHGVLALVAQYRAVGHAIPGIIMGSLKQYTHLGDAVNITDNKIYNSSMGEHQSDGYRSGKFDDRWAFTSKSTALNYGSAAGLAAAARALKGYNDELANECVNIAVGVWNEEQNKEPDLFRVGNTTGGMLEHEELKTAVELLLTTGNKKYTKRISEIFDNSGRMFAMYAPLFIKAKPYMDSNFDGKIRQKISEYIEMSKAFTNENPFGVPITRGGWAGNSRVLSNAANNYIFYKHYPDLIDKEDVFKGLNYVLGCHPGSNISFVSGVGTVSKKVAYGMNRADYSFIAGGVVPGVIVMPPDFPENKENWPFLWGENEYVIPVPMMYMYLVHAVNDILSEDF